MYNPYDAVVVKPSVPPAQHTDGTVNGSPVDRAATGGSDGSLVVVVAGDITDGSHAVDIQDSDDGATGWSTVPAGQLQGSVPTLGASESDTVAEVGVVTSKRFLRVVITTTGSTTGGVLGAAVVLGESRSIPVRRG